MMNRKRAHSEPSEEERQESNGSDQPDQLSDRRTPEIGSKPHYCTLDHWNAYREWKGDSDMIRPDDVADVREYMVRRLNEIPPPPEVSQACWTSSLTRLLRKAERADLTESEWVILTKASLIRFLRLGWVTHSDHWEDLFWLLEVSFELRRRFTSVLQEEDPYLDTLEEMVTEVSGSLSRSGIAYQKTTRNR